MPSASSRPSGHWGWPMAVASSSHNANQMMQAIQSRFRRDITRYLQRKRCGRDLRRGKPDPEIFVLAAAELGLPPARCFVVEDAPAGIEAARAGGMMALGVARLGDAELLRAAGADSGGDKPGRNRDRRTGWWAARPSCGMIGPFEMERLLEPTSDPAWLLAKEGFDPLREEHL